MTVVHCPFTQLCEVELTVVLGPEDDTDTLAYEHVKPFAVATHCNVGAALAAGAAAVIMTAGPVAAAASTVAAIIVFTRRIRSSPG